MAQQFSRRGMVGGALALGAIPAFLSRPAVAAQTEIAPGVFDIGLRNIPLNLARQDCESWCWSACLEAIFRLWGHHKPQRRFVRDLFGDERCSTATDSEILRVIRRRHVDLAGRRFDGAAFVAKDRGTNPYNMAFWDIMKIELMRGQPLLGGYTHRTGGHAVVITHARYRRNPYGGPDQLLALTVRDPWRGSPERRQLSYQELRNLDLVVAVSVRGGRSIAG